MKIEISNKYKPFFELLNPEKYPEVDTVIMTGGRASAKSFNTAIFSNVALIEFGWNILYTRYTNMSIVDSVKPEVSDKIELLGYENRVNDTTTHIECGDNRISFKGIKTGSKVQTANLKSLSGFNCFVVDEAEEIPDYETFKKVYFSIRSTTKRNLTILILNPTTKDHWIFQEYFEKKGLEGGENCIIDNVMYIHTSYLDVKREFIAKNIVKEYERMKVENPQRYENIVVGGWVVDPEGVLIPRSTLKFADLSIINPKDVIFSFSMLDPADKGGDKFSVPFCWVLQVGNQIRCYIKDVIHNTDGTEANVPRIVEKSIKYGNTHLYIETNGIGLSAYHLLKRDKHPNQKLNGYPQGKNKETRIMSHYEFVRDNFVFDKNFEQNPEYKSFISDLTSYSKEGDNKHKKDAIDVLCAVADGLKDRYRSVIFSS